MVIEEQRKMKKPPVLLETEPFVVLLLEEVDDVERSWATLWLLMQVNELFEWHDRGQ
jgi:hypothetical protein